MCGQSGGGEVGVFYFTQTIVRSRLLHSIFHLTVHHRSAHRVFGDCSGTIAIVWASAHLQQNDTAR